MKRNYYLVSGMLVVMLSFFAVNNSAHAQLYVNEFMASNDFAMPGPQGDYPDWIEIYNAGGEDVMLGGYYMSDVLDDPLAMYQIPSTYPDSVTVPAGGFILFYANNGGESSVLNLNFKLGSNGEAIGLWDAQSVIIDSLSYGAQTEDISYGRFPDGTDTWGFMADFTPGTANTNPTPPLAELYINEFMASNDDAVPGPQGDYPDWIEIYNAGIEDVMLGGYLMCDTLDATVAYEIPNTYPDSVTVEAGGFIIFYANKDEDISVLNLDFKLDGDGEQVGLWDPNENLLDGITYEQQFADTSYGRYVDGSNNWYLMTDYTPGAPNANPNPGPGDIELYINEFMASNDDAVPGPQGDYPDWIEIYNAGTEDVMLGGYFMCDTLNIAEAYQIPDTYPDSVTVEAGGFIVFYANKDEDISVLNLDFSIKGGGEQIGLWDPSQAFVDSLTYTEQFADTSYGRYPDGGNEWFMMPDYTPGESNQPAGINEISNNISAVQNFPNPFSTQTNIRFTLEKPEQLSIKIFDVRGSFIKEIANGKYSTGTHSVTFEASDMPAGYYYYRLQTSTSVQTEKALIIR